MNSLVSSTEFSRKIRVEVLRMVYQARASHIGSCYSAADILAVLYQSVLSLYATDPAWPGRDRFILSKGHSAAAVYAALALKGFFSIDELQTYGQDESPFMAHVSHRVPGVEFSTGSLGHGLPFGVGKALAAKKQGASWRVFALLSDGELDEGSNWEALMFAAHHQLDNLVAIIDYNKLQSLTSVANTLKLEPLVGKFTAFGCVVREVDGHDHDQLRLALQDTPWEPGVPSVLIAHTVKGRGVSFMENKVEWHYKSPNTNEFALALNELGESLA